jgi:hypothetical protein
MQAQTAIVVAALLSLSLPTTTPAPRRDGQWTISIDVAIDGAEKKLPGRTIKQCITPEDAAEGRSALPKPSDGLDGCKASEHKVDGNRVTWTFTCSSPQSVAGSGKIVYHDDSAYTGTIRMTSEGRAMTITYSGKRLRDCVK